MILDKFKQWLSAILIKPYRFEYLRKFPMFSNFNNHELYLFSQIIQERHFKDGEIIYQEEFPLAVIYLIAKGEIELKEYVGDQVVTDILAQNQFLGIIDMYNETRRKGKARAKQATTLLAISHLDFQAFIKINPKTGVKLLNNICNNLSHFVVDMQNSLKA